MRAISRDFIRDGEAMFQKFHQHDKRRHAWYYRSCAAGLKSELGDTPAWQELDELVGQVFDGVESLAPMSRAKAAKPGGLRRIERNRAKSAKPA